VYKLVVVEIMIVIAMWYGVRFMIESLDHDVQLKAYETVAFLRDYQASTRTLLSFMLVFYYQQIYARAKDIFFQIPWPDNPFFTCNAIVGNDDERGRLLRAAVFRYVLATTFMIFHSISAKFVLTYPGAPPLLSIFLCKWPTLSFFSSPLLLLFSFFSCRPVPSDGQARYLDRARNPPG
jgi:hypothetical protein